MCEGGLAFVMMLTRLAHPFYGRTLEFMFGADRTRITRWTNACLIWFFDEFNHLLQLNIQRFVERAPEYAAAVARKMGAVHGGRNILFVDGIFVCVPTCPSSPQPPMPHTLTHFTLPPRYQAHMQAPRGAKVVLFWCVLHPPTSVTQRSPTRSHFSHTRS